MTRDRTPDAPGPDDGPGRPPAARPLGRDERLRAALRANLARRKAQARGRAAAPDPDGGDGPPTDDTGRDVLRPRSESED